MNQELELEKINNMSHIDLARLWRFAPIGDERMQGKLGKAVSERLFKHFGGFTPEISKLIG